MQVLRKTRLFSINEAMVGFAWMNDKLPVPHHDSALAAEHVHREISRYVQAVNEAPVLIRMNPWSIFELPMDRWHRFPFWHAGRIVIIPVVPESKVVPGRVHCVGCEETVVAMKAVRA
jgi:hypothetical protein